MNQFHAPNTFLKYLSIQSAGTIHQIGTNRMHSEAQSFFFTKVKFRFEIIRFHMIFSKIDQSCFYAPFWKVSPWGLRGPRGWGMRGKSWSRKVHEVLEVQEVRKGLEGRGDPEGPVCSMYEVWVFWGASILSAVIRITCKGGLGSLRGSKVWVVQEVMKV